jgi:hypothetical protein
MSDPAPDQEPGSAPNATPNAATEGASPHTNRRHRQAERFKAARQGGSAKKLLVGGVLLVVVGIGVLVGTAFMADETVVNGVVTESSIKGLVTIVGWVIIALGSVGLMGWLLAAR